MGHKSLDAEWHKHKFMNALENAQINCVNGIIVQYFESSKIVTLRELRENIFSVYYKDVTDVEIENIIKSVSKFYNYQKITVVNNNGIFDKTGTVPDLIKDVEKYIDSLFVFDGLEYTYDELVDVLANFN